MIKYEILKLKASSILEYCKKVEHIVTVIHNFQPYEVDLSDALIYDTVVIEQMSMDSCALFEQLMMVKGLTLSDIRVEERNTYKTIIDSLLYDLVIVDFENLYKSKTDIEEDTIRSLVENGFILKTGDISIHMLPFDKSGNMYCR